MALPPLRQPAGTPCYLVGGHGIEPDALHDDFDFAVGHGRKRKVQTTAPRYVDVGLDLSEEQAAAYDAWFENALEVGNGLFTAEVARLGANTRYWAAQWVGPPQWDSRAAAEGIRWRLTGRLLLTGEGSDTAPETGALAMEYVSRLTGSVSLTSQVFFEIEYLAELSGSSPMAMEYRSELLAIITTGPVTFMPAAGSLTFTGRAPSFGAGRSVQPASGALTLAGEAPTGGGVGGSGWNPSDKSAHITLSNSNRTMAGDGTLGGVRGLLGQSTGVLYFEIAVDSDFNVGDANGFYAGLYDSTADITAQPVFGAAGGFWGAMRFNTQYGDDSGFGSNFAGGSLGSGAHVLGFVADFSTRTLSMLLDGVSKFTNAHWGSATTMYPFGASATLVTGAMTLRTLASEFTQSIPGGASAWEP